MNICLALGMDSAHTDEKQLHYKNDDASILIIFDDIFQ